MLIELNTHLRVYVIRYDYGFAPNPFYGYCTLATCKPDIRKSAQVGDWILGVGGADLGQARRKCILLMKVSEKMSFEEYWNDARFSLKKPARNGSNIQMIGDNIYHKDLNGGWLQEDSRHSNPDGTIHRDNLKRDTGTTNQVLISKNFFYFGSKAIPIDLGSISYVSAPGYKKIHFFEDIESGAARNIVQKIYNDYKNDENTVIADPCQFEVSHKRIDQKTGKSL